MSNAGQKVCLSIAGLDPSGGAGVLADIKTFFRFGCYGAAAVTSVTFQNTTGVFGAVHQTPDSVRRQIEAVLDDLDVSALKTGMLPTVGIIEVVAECLRRRRPAHVVIDPVVRSTSGFDLIDDSALAALTKQLFALSDVVTPNLAEAERIASMQIRSDGDMAAAARIMQTLGARNVLIKGGHRLGTDRPARDVLFTENGVEIFDAEFIATTSTHGTGCTLAAAIAANLALGCDLNAAVSRAKRYVTEAIRNAPGIGHGSGPIDHLVTLQE